MNNSDKLGTDHGGDVVLRETWRAKDALAARDGYNVDKLFEEARNLEKTLKHRLISSIEEIEQTTK
jgi:hypothetical protein